MITIQYSQISDIMQNVPNLTNTKITPIDPVFTGLDGSGMPIFEDTQTETVLKIAIYIMDDGVKVDGDQSDLDRITDYLGGV